MEMWDEQPTREERATQLIDARWLSFTKRQSWVGLMSQHGDGWLVGGSMDSGCHKISKKYLFVRGGVKKILFFFTFGQKGGGGLGQSKKSLSENIQIIFGYF